MIKKLFNLFKKRKEKVEETYRVDNIKKNDAEELQNKLDFIFDNIEEKIKGLEDSIENYLDEIEDIIKNSSFLKVLGNDKYDFDKFENSTKIVSTAGDFIDYIIYLQKSPMVDIYDGMNYSYDLLIYPKTNSFVVKIYKLRGFPIFTYDTEEGWKIEHEDIETLSYVKKMLEEVLFVLKNRRVFESMNKGLLFELNELWK